jgi:flap endonuclease-1
MGVKDFFKIRLPANPGDLNEVESRGDEPQTIGNFGKIVTLKKLHGTRVCVDASLMIYTSILAAPELNTLTDSEGRTTVHLNTIFNKIIQLREAGIDQIWIFDSPTPNPIKRLALEKRSARKQKALDENHKNKDKLSYRLNKEHVGDIQSLLDAMGIMYITAPPEIEAEQYGAFLTRGPESERYCQYMLSGDSDVLCFGGNLLRISTVKSGASRKTVYRTFDLEDLLTRIGLTYDQFLEVCVLMGTDFNTKKPGVGPATILRDYQKGESFITPRMKLTIKYFKSDIADKIGESNITRDQSEYDRARVVDLLVGRGFNRDRVERRLDSFEESTNETVAGEE